MKNYKLIGLTGTTGAGKSEVAELFRDKGYEVVYADSLAREIMNNPDVLSLLRENFGRDIADNNTLNRGLLAERAFKNKDTKKLLDSITHPFVSDLFLKELKRLNELEVTRILFDAPQLFESGLDVVCDCVVAVIAPGDIRLKRIKERDKLSEEQAKRRINVQFSDEFFIENSDYIIDNNSDYELLKEKVSKVFFDLEVRFGSNEKA